MFGLSHWELLIVLVVLLLLFGSRLPSIMRGLGKSVTEFKRGMNDITEDASYETRRHEEPPQPERRGEQPNPPAPE